MKTVIAIRHIMFEDLGNFYDVLAGEGFNIQYIDATSNNIDIIQSLKYDLLVILGGPVSANHTEDYPLLLAEIALIQSRIKSKKPTIGICLGAQLIAKACGARVYAGQTKEIGWGKVDITDPGRTHPIKQLHDMSVLRWHG